ncbi:hypothetical protein [Halomonas sp. KX33721]|jgi:hypothetical protein|uniref:hypothetical protein n=1 Tax=Halomonas sp. KX33721 TaxID=1819251 RepID=UPI0007824D6A|nr:hypothetical protein [Halomonas sp. KX33721]
MTPEQEAAIAKIPQYLEGWQSEKGEKIAALVYCWLAGTETTRDDKDRITTRPTGKEPDKVVQAAKEDPAAWEASRMLVAGLAEQEEPIPSPLLRFTAAVMRDQWPKPSGGRPKHKNLARDLRIANAVYMLKCAGIQLSQNDETQATKSAFHLVARHAALSPSAVKTIWRNIGPHVIESRTKGPFYFHDQPLKLKF